MNQGFIYLLHFKKPISEAHTCQHYLGWCRGLAARIQSHEHGSGARLTEVAAERGISFTVARVWRGSRTDERQLKNRKNAPRMCPFCSKRPLPVAYLDELTAAEIKSELIPF